MLSTDCLDKNIIKNPQFTTECSPEVSLAGWFLDDGVDSSKMFSVRGGLGGWGYFELIKSEFEKNVL